MFSTKGRGVVGVKLCNSVSRLERLRGHFPTWSLQSRVLIIVIQMRQIPRLLVPLNLPCKRSDFPLSKERKSLVRLSCPRHHEEEEVSARSREGSASLVFLFCLFYPLRGLAKPSCLAPGGCERQAMLCAVSMAVGRWGHVGIHSQVAGAAHLLGSWQPRYRGDLGSPFCFSLVPRALVTVFRSLSPV